MAASSSSSSSMASSSSLSSSSSSSSSIARKPRDATGALIPVKNPHADDIPIWYQPLPRLAYDIPAHIRPLHDKVLAFIEEHLYPIEAHAARSPTGPSPFALRALQVKVKEQGLWALGHPKAIGGGGLPFMDYVYINEAVGRSHLANFVFGTHSLQDSLMLIAHCPAHLRERYLPGLFAAELFPSFAMTEPDVAGSDPTGIKTEARVDPATGEWVINGRKWFTTYGSRAAYTAVMVRTEFDSETPLHRAFSIILVPTDTKGYDFQRDTHFLGVASHESEVVYTDVRVPYDHLIGKRGNGFRIAQERLGPGRIFHCMRWLGQAERAFDLMCNRMIARTVRDRPLAQRQLMQKFVFDSYAEIQSCRLLTLNAAAAIDRNGSAARIDIGLIKVVGATMVHNVIDRAVQCFGAAGLTEDTPLADMYRTSRAARIYDGPDEVHVQNVSAMLLQKFGDGPSTPRSKL